MCMLCTPVLTQMLIQGTMPLKAKSSSFLYGTNTPNQTMVHMHYIISVYYVVLLYNLSHEDDQ